jgi:hypothetical protein
MTHKKLTPPLAIRGGVGSWQSLAACGSEIIESLSKRQAHYIARRFGINATLAALIAATAFGSEARANG